MPWRAKLMQRAATLPSLLSASRPFFPMPVRIQNGGKRPLAAPERAIQVAAEVEAGQRLEIDLLHAVTLTLDLAEDLRLERGLLRHRPQAAAHEDLLANLFGPRLPFLPGSNRRKLAGGVEVLDCRRASPPGPLAAQPTARAAPRHTTTRTKQAQAQKRLLIMALWFRTSGFGFRLLHFCPFVM